MKDIFAQHGNTFCSAPWTTLWSGANGDIKFCCATTEVLGNTNTQSMESIINGPIANKTRLQFLKGEKPRECGSCWEREEQGVVVGHPREFSNKISENAIPYSLKETNKDGSLWNHRIKFFDIIWTNKCNFACLHCIPSLSSTIASTHKDTFGIWLNNSHHGNFDYWADPDKIDNTEKINYILKNSDSIDLLHFNGGEPLLQEETFTLLEELKKKGLQKKIKLWFHTNGSVRTYKNVDIVEDYLKDWKNCYINMSHDHFGARGEYFRYGYKDKKWLETYNRFRSANIEVHIDTSITLFNALTLKDLLLWYKDNGILQRQSILGWDYISGPIIWNLMNLTYNDELKHQVKQSLNDTLDTIDSLNEVVYNQFYRWKTNIQGLLSSLNNGYDFNTVKSQFVKAIDALDEKRQTNFLNSFPELEYFYRTMQNDQSVS